MNKLKKTAHPQTSATAVAKNSNKALTTRVTIASSSMKRYLMS